MKNDISRRSLFRKAAVGSAAVVGSTMMPSVIEAKPVLNLSRGEPGSVLATIENTIQDMIKREAGLLASGRRPADDKTAVKVAWRKVPTADDGFTWINEPFDDVEWPKQTIEEKQREMLKK